MKIRRAVPLLVVPLIFLAQATAWAQQAWVPARGEAFFTLSYQWLEADRHIISNAVAGPELTPIEEFLGLDFDSKFVDFGTVQSMALVLDADIGITDRLALFGGLAFIAPRYLGDFPDSPTDDGDFHGSFQDARIGARYMAVNNGSWVLTPFAAFVFPATGYPAYGHTARGLGLKELQVGTNVGRILSRGGVPKAYVHGAYSYAFMENVSDHITLDRSSAFVEFGYFFGRRLTVQVLSSWRKVHGGMQWADLGSSIEHSIEELIGNPDLDDSFHAHDRSAATHEWRLGGGVDFQVSDSVDVYVSVNNMLWGVNTHDAATINFGFNWGFQMFGGFGDWDEDLWKEEDEDGEDNKDKNKKDNGDGKSS